LDPQNNRCAEFHLAFIHFCLCRAKEPGLSMGPGTLTIPLKLFADNRSRLVSKLKEARIPENAVVFLQGGNSLPLYNTDVDYNFRQEPFFQWAFGVREPGCAGTK